MRELEISPNFTIDIHKIRKNDAERRRVIGDKAYWAEVRADSLYGREKSKKREKGALRKKVSAWIKPINTLE